MNQEYQRLMRDERYLGRFIGDMITPSDYEKNYRHPIYLYTPTQTEQETKKMFKRLNKVVNVYKHTISDFMMNGEKIIDHYVRYYGDPGMGMFTLGQSITFRVYPGQEPVSLPLFGFFLEYTMLLLPITLKADLSNWEPLHNKHWTTSIWTNRIDEYIELCRPLGNHRAIGECLEYSKYLVNEWVAKAGDKLALSLDNNMIIELMRRSDEIRKTITCKFDIPEDADPKTLETIATKRTDELLNFAGKQYDIPISVYARNKLFVPSQAKEFFTHIVHKPDIFGHTIPYTYPTNNIMGTKDVRAHMVDANGGRKAEMLKLYVSDAGAMERSLAMMMSPMRFVDCDWECDSKHYRIRHIDSADVLDKLDGRVCTFNPDSDEYIIIDPRNTDLIGKTLYIKTPITCTHPRRNEGYICSACYGKLMSNLNRDVHIGRLAALNSADDIEQILLSAKHALNTNTKRVLFNDNFYQYFEAENCVVFLNDDMVEASLDPNSDFYHLHMEFHLATMGKHHDGEGRSHDRSTTEIIIFNDRTNERTIVTKDNNSELFLSRDFVNNHFLPALRYLEGDKETIRIPFSDLVDTGETVCEDIFEYEYENQELAFAILALTKILDKGSRINAFSDYNECLNTLIPLFAKGGINIPELQCEMLVAKMIYTPDGKEVDWNEPNPEYQFYSIDKSIQNINSALTSMLYRDTAKQIEGNYGTYEKTGTSTYDWFLLQRSGLLHGMADDISDE